MKASKTVLVRVLFVVLVTTVSYPVSAQLKADFTATPQAGCAPLVVTFTDNSSGTPSSWHWDLGNGVISTEPNPITSYFDPGTYTIKLIVYNGSNTDSIVKTSYITVYQNPVAAFSLSDSTGCFPLNVNYLNNSTAGSGAITSNVWDFGDGNTINTASPTHSYTSPGMFSVTLTVTNTYGCTNTFSKKNVINVTQGVHAAFNINTTSICHSPAAVSFSQAATGTGALTYQWNFGDGGSAASGSPKHNYTQSGNYIVSFKVISPLGCSDSTTKSLPIAFVKSAISISDTICSNRQVQFVNSASPTPASSVWTFGDNTSATGINPTKAYAQNGLYTVKVVNTFFAGCIDSTSKIVTVSLAPQASFNVIDSASCSLPFTANFKNTSAGTGMSTVWDFGDGTTSTSFDGVHQYTKYGSYTVTLKTFNPNGCDTSVSKTNAVVIEPIKIDSLSGFSTSKCVPATVNPSVVTNVPVGIATYNWDFGDGTVVNSAKPTHTYTTAGIYTVKVTIQTAAGCTASYSFADSVGNKLNASFTVSPTNVCASTQVTFNNTTIGNSSFLWWYPGDGDTIYKQPNPSHNYKDTGWFSPTLVVEQYGCYDTVIEKNAVHIKGPVAKYLVKNNCINKLQVNFINNSIDDKTRKWSFGDGATDTAANPVHNYSQPGIYLTTLFVSNNKCTYTDSVPVKVVSEHGTASISDTDICHGTNILLNIAGMNNTNVNNTVWYMGNGATTTATHSTNSAYTYSTDGKYAVYAVVTDILGCADTLTLPYKVSVFGPYARLIALEPGACKNGTINFADTSRADGLHPITAWKFDYGDNTVVNYSAKTQFAHKYIDTGLYAAKMTVTDNFGCSSSSATNVHITQPYASFKLSDTLVCPGKQVAFTNTTVAVGATYKWYFGDGATATTTNTSHLYTVQGIYTPHLYVTDINNCKDSAVLATGVSVYLPSAKFVMSDSFSTCPPLTVNFANQSKNYVSFQWSFGDGNTSVVASAEHEYTYPGVYPAKLIVKGDGGCADSSFKNITIKGPTGTLQVNQTAACYPFTEKLTAVSQNAVQYLWDYSDGNTNLTTVNTASHAYQPGTYVPKLILIDAAGCKVPIRGTDTIKVFDLQTKGFASNSLFCDSGKVSFNDTSVTNDLVTLSKWMFGDNTSATGTAVTHNYNATGTYNVKLVDITAHGCTDTLIFTTPIKVVASPVIDVAGTTSFCVPASVSLQGGLVKPDTSALSWSWIFGNGMSSSTQNPSGIVFTTASNYNVSVTATNSSGCKGVASGAIIIHSLPAVKAGNDTSICRNGTVTLQATGAVSYIWANTPGISCTACSTPMVIPDSTSLYTVTGKDQYGCTASDSITVKVTQPVKISVSNRDTLCNGDSKQLTASGAQTYQWYPAIYLSDAATAQPTFHASKDTSITYSVIGFAENKCFADTATVKVKVYPIPEMQVAQSAITADAGTSVQLSTINSADVTKWKWSPAMYLTNPNIPNPIAQPRESITYTVVAANDGACVTRAQIAVTVTCGGANVFVPNTFSPNGDGMNDKFYARGTGLYNIKSFRIFNRWGQLVYEKLNGGANNAADGWDGTVNGQPAPSDVYVYMIEIMCINDTVVPVKGNVTLLR